MTALRRMALLALGAVCGIGILVAPSPDGPAAPGLQEAADTGQFRPGNIISDQLFYDGAAMSPADVQFFLESKNPRCVPASDGTPCLQDARQDTYTRPADANCPGTYVGAPAETAATIIAKVGAACGISQRVLLVILQKEQGLVTLSGNNLTARRYERAMGYACPDTAPCNPAYAHLFNQVYSAAARYRYYAGNADQFNHRAGRVNTVRFHPDAGCGSTQLFIENAATAGLYNYTPYQPNAAALAAGKGTGDACSAYGNRNFWIYYTDWFGSTQVPGASEVTGRYARTGGQDGPLGAIKTNVVCGLPAGGCFQTYAAGAIYWSPATGARILSGPVRDRWAAAGWERGALGYPVGDPSCGLRDGGCFQHFQGGSIYWSPATGARVLSVEVRDRWGAAGWENGALGYPVSDVGSLKEGGRFVHFQGGSIYWSPGTGARIVSGVVRDRWAASGWENGPLGYPVGDVTRLADGGMFAHFQRGSVYWSSGTGARLMLSPVRDRWGSAGWENGALGYPVTDQVATPGGAGQVVQFQRGWIYWSADGGARVVGGAVRDAWLAAGGDAGDLGMPIADAGRTADGVAEFGRFSGGAVYLHPDLGTRVVPGPVVTAWDSAGGIGGPLGYPVADAVATSAGVVMAFQGGEVYAASGTGHALHGAVRDRYNAAGGPEGELGYPTTGVRALSDGGTFAHFQNGSIYWTQATGARIVSGPVRDRWAAAGWQTGVLGYPTGEVRELADGGTVTAFQGGSVYWSQATGARLVSGAVLDRFSAAGGPGGSLGYPTTDVTALAGGGRFAHFQGGSVYWTQATGARVVSGAVRDRWAAGGWENGVLGFPTTDVTALAGGGRFAHFQGGSVYWTQATGARVVSGAVRDRWAAGGWENGVLGFPTTDVTALAGGGRFAHFQGGSVYWTQGTGARVVSGAVRDRWAAGGWENGVLGYPTTDVTALAGGGRFAHFQGGSVYWTSTTGARLVRGAIRDAWAAAGWENGRLGYPTADPETVSGGTRQTFQGGTITAVNGRTSVTYK